MFTNLRYALRSLLKSPGFTAVALLTLALGIGVNTAIFSLVNSVMFRPLSFPESERLVRIWASVPERGLDRTAMSYMRFEYLRDQNEVFTDVAANTFAGIALTGGPEPIRLDGNFVSSAYFKALGLRPQIGRDFTGDDDREGAADVAIISDGLWRRQFNSSPAVLGQIVTLNGRPATIIGVMPPRLAAPLDRIDVWQAKPFDIPFLSPEQIRNGAGYLFITARLRGGIGLARATESVKIIASRYQQANPGRVDAKFDIAVIPYLDEIVGDRRPAFYTLFAAVGVVLLIACANVANLLLTRFAGRSREIAVRTALGATRRKIVGQFLIECVLLSGIAGLAGAFLAHGGVQVLGSVAAEFVPRAGEISVDLTALAFAFGVSLVTGLLMGIYPAFQASRLDVVETLKDASRGSSSGARSGVFRQFLLVGEIALSLVLLVTASLLVVSFSRLRNVETGFSAEGVLAGFVSLPPARYDTREKHSRFLEDFRAQLLATPGIESAAVASGLPLVENNYYSPFWIKGRPEPAITEAPLALANAITPGYFRTLGIPLRQGRDFNERDRTDSPTVAIINESFARQYFPDGNALGQRIATGLARRESEIVGVIGDHRVEGLAQNPRPQVFFAATQRSDSAISIVVRTSQGGDPAALTPLVRNALRSVDTDLPLTDPRTMESIVAGSLAERRMIMGLLGGFAFFALALAALGIYSVMAFSVAQRTTEIGIRMALGADPRAVQALVVREGLRTVLIGVAVGLVAALGFTRLMRAQLFGVGAAHPLVYGAIALFVVAVAAAACWLPARRASRIDPLVAIRSD